MTTSADPTGHDSPNPLDSLLKRLREAAGGLSPAPLSEETLSAERWQSRMRPVLDSFFEQFQLVPKRDFDAHLRKLSRLETTVSDLEARIAELEQDG